MADTLDPLVLDLVEWVAGEPRRYSDVIEAWRTSCPRLTVWEDALDRGFLRRETARAGSAFVVVTPLGEKFLRDHHRTPDSGKRRAVAVAVGAAR
jgi:hypothetical protein